MIFKHLRPATAVKVGVVLVQLALAGHAMADDDTKMFTVGGFGTLGMTHSSIDTADYVSGPFAPHGAGRSGEWSPDVDSKVALQVSAKFNQQWSAVVQVISSLNTDNNYVPHIEWANVKYAFSPDLSVRLGRIALPVFMASDTRLVGYANPWVRAPLETYSMYALTNSDGIDGSWSQSIRGARNTVQAWYGSTKVDSVGPSGAITDDISSTNMRGISDTVEYGALTVRVGMHFSNLKFQLPNNGRKFNLTTKTTNIGAMYDPGDWFVQGELTRMTRTSLGAALPVWDQAISVVAGYRINSFTPYVMHSRISGRNGSTSTRAQETNAAGLRWDVYKNIAVKAQLDHVSVPLTSNGFFTNVLPGLKGSSGKVASLVVDFMY